MSFLVDLSNHIKTLVTGDVTLSGVFTSQFVYIHLPQSYPCICIDGIGRSELTKQVSYALNINFWSDGSANDAAADAAFYDTADKLQAVLETSSAIVAGSWVARPEPQNGRLRALFTCTVYPAGL